jgi:excisionase family DNA binding protein
MGLRHWVAHVKKAMNGLQVDTLRAHPGDVGMGYTPIRQTVTPKGRETCPLSRPKPHPLPPTSMDPDKQGLTGFAILSFPRREQLLVSRSSVHHDMLTIGQAATLVGVSVSTLRNWDRAKKLTAHRHPINGYRLYRRAELLALVKEIKGLRRAPGKGGRR